MKINSINRLISLGVLLALCTSCNKKSDDPGGSGSSSVTIEKPSGIISSVSAAVASGGKSMSGVSGASMQSGDIHNLLAESSCDQHGDPSGLNYSQGAYPGTLTYCKLTKNDGSPDTVQGGFALVKNVSCALENAGISFDGQPHSTTITIDSTCFTAKQISEMGGSMTVTVTAAKPASFNTYYDAGITIAIPSFGTFQIGTKIAGTKMEFASFENQSSTKQGSTYGSLDTSTGELRYETRMERIGCTTSGECGWNRHIKLYAELKMNGTTPGDIKSVSFGYANIQNSPGQSGPGGLLVTASGNLTSGIKPRLWQSTNGSGGSPASLTDVQTIGKWVETTNSACYTSSSEAALTCGSGISGMTSSTAFLLTGGSYTTSSNWFTNFAGATFTAVDVNAD